MADRNFIESAARHLAAFRGGAEILDGGKRLCKKTHIDSAILDASIRQENANGCLAQFDAMDDGRVIVWPDDKDCFSFSCSLESGAEIVEAWDFIHGATESDLSRPMTTLPLSELIEAIFVLVPTPHHDGKSVALARYEPDVFAMNSPGFIEEMALLMNVFPESMTDDEVDHYLSADTDCRRNWSEMLSGDDSPDLAALHYLEPDPLRDLFLDFVSFRDTPGPLPESRHSRAARAPQLGIRVSSKASAVYLREFLLYTREGREIHKKLDNPLTALDAMSMECPAPCGARAQFYRAVSMRDIRRRYEGLVTELAATPLPAGKYFETHDLMIHALHGLVNVCADRVD